MCIVVACSAVNYVVNLTRDWIHGYGTTFPAVHKALFCYSLDRKQVLWVRLLLEEFFKSFLAAFFHEFIRPDLFFAEVINSTQCADVTQFA